jgi:hypothetical protein
MAGAIRQNDGLLHFSSWRAVLKIGDNRYIGRHPEPDTWLEEIC